MKITNIISTRTRAKEPSFDLIYEWEDDLSQILSLPIYNPWSSKYRIAYIHRYSKRVLSILGRTVTELFNNAIERNNQYILGRDDYSLVFELYTELEPHFSNSSKSIPVLVDYWKNVDLKSLYKAYKNCKLVLVTNLEAVNYLNSKKCPLNIVHFPLSLSDRYKLNENIIYEKKYDILLAGRLNIRTNQVLRNYLDEFIIKYPGFTFLYQKEIDNEFYYVSNHGELIGKFQTRQDYINLLRASKVSFYSTPGIDGGEKRTGGFNPVTPRYLELLSAQCLLLGKYPKNDDTDYYELEKVCPNITSYEHFEQTLLQYLNTEKPSFEVHRAILSKHYTSCRAKLLMDIIGYC